MKRANTIFSFHRCLFTALFAVNGLCAPLYPQESGAVNLFKGFTGEVFSYDGYPIEEDTAGADEERPEDSADEIGEAAGQGGAAAQAVTNTAVSGKTASSTPPTVESGFHSYFFWYTHSVRQGARFAAGAVGRSYIGYLQLESPLPMPYFEVSLKNFGVGLYPLAELQTARPEKNIPSLFIGAGCLTFPPFLKTANCLSLSGIKPAYAGPRFPRENLIGMGSTQKEVQYGVELYGGGWNGVFFASPEKKKRRMRYGLIGAWRMNRKKSDIKLNVQYLTAFMPELEGTLIQSAGSPEAERETGGSFRQRYHKLFGLAMLFMHPIISFETAGLCSYAAEKTVSGGIRAEANLFYRYFGINGGGSYTAPLYIGWDDRVQQEQISSFIQPYVKIGIFSLHTVYAFNMEEKKQLHNAGVTVQVKHKNIRWKVHWSYGKEIHTIKTGISLISSPSWFRRIRWFEKASIETAVQLQEKRIYPFVLKKYIVNAVSGFYITEWLSCGFRGGISQSAVTAGKTAIETGYTEHLQYPVCSGSIFVQMKRKGTGSIHSGKAELSVKNEKPFFDVKIAYQIQRK